GRRAGVRTPEGSSSRRLGRLPRAGGQGADQPVRPAGPGRCVRMPVNRAMTSDFTTIMKAFEPETTDGHVVGVGLDVVDVASFAEQLALPGSRFAGFFRTGERAEIAARGGGVVHWAARWAAKEALIKAWSTL